MPLVLYQNKLLYRNAYGGKLANSLDCCCDCVCNCAFLQSLWDSLEVMELLFRSDGDCTYDIPENMLVSTVDGCIGWSVLNLQIPDMADLDIQLSCDGDQVNITFTPDNQGANCFWGEFTEIEKTCAQDYFLAVYESVIQEGDAPGGACPCSVGETMTIYIAQGNITVP